jgi:murein L,D-transpeptidase YafK
VAGRSFKDEQLCFPRVRVAYQEKLNVLKALFQHGKTPFPPAGIAMRVLKFEGVLELWALAGAGEPFRKIRDYKICAQSGGLGPKRRQGDLQVPEGFYQVSCFNPVSRFYLSLGLNYPNQADRRRSDPESPGRDIFIHGSCLSVGCLAMTDDYIKEIYIAAVEARAGGQRAIPVHIFPAAMDAPGMERLQQAALSGSGPLAASIHNGAPEAPRQELMRFWRNLREGYERFERTGIPPAVAVDDEGSYIFSMPGKIEPEPHLAP